MADEKVKLVKVFHVDDDAFQLEKIQKALSKPIGGLKFELSSFDNDKDFLGAIAGKDKPDIILLDVHLEESDLSGDELAKKSRSKVKNALVDVFFADNYKTISRCIKNR